MNTTTTMSLLSPEELMARLRKVGEEQYHHKHPFHLLMHEGKLTPGQLQAWALNRYYYQAMIPIKDALILSRSEDPAFRRVWRKRILDHDGDGKSPGGIEKWIRLAEATGSDRGNVIEYKGILPATRFAVNAYLDLVSKHSFLVAVASSLTELFSKELIVLRVAKIKELYPHLSPALQYFEGRLTQAPEDAAMASDYVLTHARTREEQESAIWALRRKCDILWAQLDALHYCYVTPGTPPPGAFIPEKAAR